MVKCINVSDAQNNVLAEQKLAGVAELADALDLGSVLYVILLLITVFPFS